MRFAHPGLISLVWLCFLLRCLFYCSVVPLWEGFDEPFHFSYIQSVSLDQSLPDQESSQISRETAESLRSAPLPWMLRDWGAPHLSHDAWWQLPERDRRRRVEALHSLPPQKPHEPRQVTAPRQYEAQQLPFYYVVMAMPYRLIAARPLAERVWLLRLSGAALASLVVPLGFLVAKEVLCDDGQALAVVSLAAAMPELMLNLCRVSNETLALVLMTAFQLLLVRGSTNMWCGVTLGLGLLTKAYFLTAIPVVGLMSLRRTMLFLRNTRKTESARAANHRGAPRTLGARDVPFALFRNSLAQPRLAGRWIREFLPVLVGRRALCALLAGLIAGWFYARNWMLHGSFSGVQQEVALRGMPKWELAKLIPQVDWRNAIDSTFVSHIWFGGWSFLQARSWMYHLFAVLYLIAAAGILRRVFSRRHTGARMIAALYGTFAAGIGYHVLLTFAASGVSSSTGWYLYALVIAECILLRFGLGPQPFALLGLCFAALELFATHVYLLPYYAGLLIHKANGLLPAMPLGQFGSFRLLERLAVNKPEELTAPVIGLLWGLYVAATFTLAGVQISCTREALRFARRRSNEERAVQGYSQFRILG
jgi:hypothetical protein